MSSKCNSDYRERLYDAGGVEFLYPTKEGNNRQYYHDKVTAPPGDVQYAPSAKRMSAACLSFQ
jgi:hypothetical protein